MTDWYKRITDIISQPDEPQATVSEEKQDDLLTLTLYKNREKASHLSFSAKKTPQRQDPTYKSHLTDIAQTAQTVKTEKPVVKNEGNPMTTPTEDDDNLKALKHLRDLPRGSQVDARIAGVQNLLGEMEVFKTLKMIRWPQGVMCPRCHSQNVVRREPPPDAMDKRHYYVCLNCKGDGSPSDFDDFTGLPMGSLHALRQWILCWYLIGFCSVHQIAKVLGISLSSVIQMATLGSEITDIPGAEASSDKALERKEKKENDQRQSLEQTNLQEDLTRSASKSPFKPGYKSKK